MKSSACSRIRFLTACLLFVMTMNISVQAQICLNPTDTIYSMSTTGVIYPINVITAQNGTGVTTNLAAVNANGLGYSSLNGKFYFFNITATGAAPSPQFASYSPATSTFATLATPPASITPAVTQKIRTGCVNNLGSGYYTINPSTSAGVTPSLYYYNILTDTWTTVTNLFQTPALISQNVTIHNLNSGDMAFDGTGNLWIVCSNSAQYTLYEILSPVPTTAVASVTVQQIIAPIATPAGVSLTGLAFNASGALFLSSGGGGGGGNNLLYKMASVASGLTLVGTLPINDIGADLTSCMAPLWVLSAPSILNFSASLNNGIQLTWNANEDDATAGYNVQYSQDGASWINIAFINKTLNSTGNGVPYRYVQHQYGPNNNFYRIVQITASGKETFSVIKMVNAKGTGTVYMGPNPVKDIIYFYNKDYNSKYLARIYDHSGRLVYSSQVDQYQESLNVSHLSKGGYVLNLSSPFNGNITSLQFIKW